MKLAGCFNGTKTSYMPKDQANLISHDLFKKKKNYFHIMTRAGGVFRFFR